MNDPSCNDFVQLYIGFFLYIIIFKSAIRCIFNERALSKMIYNFNKAGLTYTVKIWGQYFWIGHVYVYPKISCFFGQNN